jgi:hypothetical protein
VELWLPVEAPADPQPDDAIAPPPPAGVSGAPD